MPGVTKAGRGQLIQGCRHAAQVVRVAVGGWAECADEPCETWPEAQTNKKSIRPTVLPDVFAAPHECDCPSCSGADVDPQQLIDKLIADTADLAGARTRWTRRSSG